jgi:hypothetical protein
MKKKKHHGTLLPDVELSNTFESNASTSMNSHQTVNSQERTSFNSFNIKKSAKWKQTAPQKTKLRTINLYT